MICAPTAVSAMLRLFIGSCDQDYAACGGDLDDEVGVQSCRDPVEMRDRWDHAAGFAARKRGLGHASPGRQFGLGQAQGQAAFSDGLADQEGAAGLEAATAPR